MQEKMDAAQGHVPLFTCSERPAVSFCVAIRAVPVYHGRAKMSMMISSSLDMLIFLFACCPSNNEKGKDYCGTEVSVTG